MDLRVKKGHCHWGINSCTFREPKPEILITELQVDERARDRILLLHCLRKLLTVVTPTRSMWLLVLLLLLCVIWQALYRTEHVKVRSWLLKQVLISHYYSCLYL